MQNSGAPQPAKWGRNLRRVGLMLAGVVAGYLALVIHPQPLFAHSLQRGNIVLYASQPLPPEATPMLDDALRRIRTSPLYDAERTHHVFVCDTPQLYDFFALWDYRSGGVTHTWASGNAFIRPSNLVRGRVIGRSGVEKGGERTLSYYVAHEVTHAMTADHTGRLRFRGSRNRSCAALDTLLTFWPPGPEERMNFHSNSSSGMTMSGVTIRAIRKARDA